MLQFRLNADGKSYTCMGVSNYKNRKIIVPETYKELPVTRIENYAFACCTSLKSIVIPDSVTEIGIHAFDTCVALESVNIPNSVTRIGDNVFYYCSSLESVVIPNSVTEIDDFAFYNCTSLESIVIPDSITKIGNYAFTYCESLKSIIIPNSVTKIRPWAFYCCTSLKSIIIPNSVTEIGSCAFYCCRSLKSIIMPNSVTRIDDGAFFGCAFASTTRRFKATKADNSCLNFIYEIGKWYHEDYIKLCRKGFHSCKSPLDIFNHYWGYIGKDIKLYEVSTKNESDETDFDSKVVSQDICLLREISISELADIASGRA